jgi:hypothetical protein
VERAAVTNTPNGMQAIYARLLDGAEKIRLVIRVGGTDLRKGNCLTFSGRSNLRIKGLIRNLHVKGSTFERLFLDTVHRECWPWTPALCGVCYDCRFCDRRRC